MTTRDKSGAETTVSRESDRFSISIAGAVVGFAEFRDEAGRRTFFHTEVNPSFQGRGLATILVRAALDATRADGMRVAAPGWMVAEYIKKSSAYDDLVDSA